MAKPRETTNRERENENFILRRRGRTKAEREMGVLWSLKKLWSLWMKDCVIYFEKESWNPSFLMRERKNGERKGG